MGSVSKPGTFLFTSESVGEGHPDKIASVLNHASYFYRIDTLANLDTKLVIKSPMPFWMRA